MDLEIEPSFSISCEPKSMWKMFLPSPSRASASLTWRIFPRCVLNVWPRGKMPSRMIFVLKFWRCRPTASILA